MFSKRPLNPVLIPFLLFLAALGTAFVAVLIPDWSDLLLLSAPAAIASLFLLLRGWVARRRSAPTPARNWVVVDGSNVMHWQDGTPQIETVQEVLRALTAKGFTPGVVFDANAGYLLSGRYRHDGYLGKVLGLPKDRVMVVPRGRPADPFILTAARDMGGRVVTNDKFRDWADDFPEISDRAHLIKGGLPRWPGVSGLAGSRGWRFETPLKKGL